MTQMQPETFDVENLYNRRATNRWERTSVGDLFERMCWSYPDKEAVVAAPGAFGYERYARLTYRQADQLANQVANALLARGFSRGDRVVFFCENTIEAYVAKIGVAKAGMVCAPINPRMAPDVQEYLLKMLAPKFAIVDAELWPAAEKAFRACDVSGAIIPIKGDVIPSGWVGFEAFVGAAPATEPVAEIHGDDIWEILPTSGTTSMPKGVMMSHNFAYIGAYSHALTHTRGLRFESDLRVCSLLPLIYHAPDQTQSFPALLAGGTVVIGRAVSAANFASVITAEKPTHLWAGSPQFIEEIVEEVTARPGTYDLGSLTSVMFAWASLRPSVADRLKEICGGDLQLVGILGQTEAIPCARFWPDKYPEIYRRSAPDINHTGLPTAILAASVMDENGTLIRQDQPNIPGEIVYRTPAVTAGYYKNETATREAFRHGWFHSGDCCQYDENGLLVMIDRFKDVIKSGGENVSTIRVEAVVRTHPAVQKVAVVGLPHERWSEAVTGVVITKPGMAVSEDELIRHCRARLAGYEAPKGFIFVAELPETVGGKVLKYVLRQRYHSHYANAA